MGVFEKLRPNLNIEIGSRIQFPKEIKQELFEIEIFCSGNGIIHFVMKLEEKRLKTHLRIQA